MKVLLWTDKNLHRYLSGGWNLKGLAEGKIATLTGKTLSVDVANEKCDVKTLKRCLEDQEGWKAEDLIVYTTAGRRVDDSEALVNCGITAATKLTELRPSRLRSTVVPHDEADKPGQQQLIRAEDGRAYRPPSLGSTTMTISPEDEHGKPQSENRQGAAAANLSGSSTSPSQLPVFAAMQGTGHRLGGAETGVRFGGNSEHEKRRAALAAAERRMRAPLG